MEWYQLGRSDAQWHFEDKVELWSVHKASFRRKNWTLKPKRCRAEATHRYRMFSVACKYYRQRLVFWKQALAFRLLSITVSEIENSILLPSLSAILHGRVALHPPRSQPIQFDSSRGHPESLYPLTLDYTAPSARSSHVQSKARARARACDSTTTVR